MKKQKSVWATCQDAGFALRKAASNEQEVLALVNNVRYNELPLYLEGTYQKLLRAISKTVDELCECYHRIPDNEVIQELEAKAVALRDEIAAKAESFTITTLEDWTYMLADFGDTLVVRAPYEEPATLESLQ